MKITDIYDKSSIFVLLRQLTFVLDLHYFEEFEKGILFAGLQCHLSYRLFWVGFILEENQLTTKGTKAHKGINPLSFVALRDTLW